MGMSRRLRHWRLVLHLATTLATTTPSLSPQHAASVSYLCQSAHPALPSIPSFSWSQVIIQHEAQFTILKSFYFASPPVRSMHFALQHGPTGIVQGARAVHLVCRLGLSQLRDVC